MRDIPGFEGEYAATSCGKIWSHKSQRFLSPYMSQGYLKVDLMKGGKRYKRKVARLVAMTYIPNPDNKPEVDHINREEKLNNCVNNLRWVTSAENKKNSTVGKKKVCTKIRCVETGVVYKNQSQAARAVGIHVYCINCAVNGKNETAAGFHWERVFDKEDK